MILGTFGISGGLSSAVARERVEHHHGNRDVDERPHRVVRQPERCTHTKHDGGDVPKPPRQLRPCDDPDTHQDQQDPDRNPEPAIRVEVVTEDGVLEPVGHRTVISERPYPVEDPHDPGEPENRSGKKQPALTHGLHISVVVVCRHDVPPHRSGAIAARTNISSSEPGRADPRLDESFVVAAVRSQIGSAATDVEELSCAVVASLGQGSFHGIVATCTCDSWARASSLASCLVSYGPYVVVRSPS